MKRIFSIFSIVLIGLFAFVACSPQASFSDELVSVSLTGSKGTVRSLIAENDFDIASVKVWKYTAEKADQGLATGASDTQIELEKDSSGNWMTQALSQGAWNFDLFGYSDDAGKVLICSGTAENQTITVANHNVKITVKPSQTATGTILVKDDIKIVDKNGKEYTGSEYTKTVKVYNSSSEDVTDQISSPVKSGRYKVTVTFTSKVNGEDYTAAKADKYINVYDNLTTTVSGTITEKEQAGVVEPEGGMISATSEEFTVTLDDNGKNKEPVKLEVASTPAGTTNNSKTTVEFPAGSIDMGTNTSLKLKVESTSIESASTSYSVETSEGAAVASLNFTLEGAKDNSTFTTEEGVVVTTIITTGLTENPVVKYVGDSTGKDPEFVSYNSTTGELKFKVFHFSTYLVLSQNVVAVDGDGKTYSSLKDALTSDSKEITVLKDAKMDENISISKSKAVDLNGKTITIGNESIKPEVIALSASDSAYKVVFKDGSITAVSSNNIFSVHTNATLVLDNVDLDATSCYAGIFLYNGANPANLEVKDSSLDINGAFGIGTNASDPNGTYVNIQIDNSILTITSSDDDNVGILCNVPSTVLISDSTISGQRQGVILRGADTTHEKKISNSTIKSTGTTTNYYDSGDYLNCNWSQGNEVPLAALVVGDRNTAYPYGTTVELDNVILEVPNESSVRKGLYIYQDGDNYPVTVKLLSAIDFTINEDANGKIICSVHTFGEWENSDNLTSSTRECSVCHEKETKDGIVVTPDTAQELINSVNSGKIYFTAGEYGDLTLTHSKKVSTAKMQYAPQSDADINNLQDDTTYAYYRSINNMELIGGEGVNIGSLTCASGQMGTLEAPIADPVKGSSHLYFSHIPVDGLTIEGMSFSGVVKFDVGVDGADAIVKNITIDNCNFKGTAEAATDTVKAQAMSFGTKFGNTFENIVITNNTVDTYFQGFYCENVKNATIKNCKISNTTHNGIAIQSDPNLKFSGSITIEGNTVSNASNRAIRFNSGENATITIEGNSFNNAVDSDKQLLKTETLTSCTYSFSGNTYNGKSIADVSGSEASWILTITE